MDAIFFLCRMEVLGSGNQCSMPHHLLYGGDVHALVQKMGCKAVAKSMNPIAFILHSSPFFILQAHFFSPTVLFESLYSSNQAAAL